MRNLLYAGTALGLLALAAGCATPAARQTAAPVFYPPAPEVPRLQFLTTYSSEQDLGGGPSKYEIFIVGRQPVNKVIGKPYGMALHGGKLYVCDTGASVIDILDFQTKTFRFFSPVREAALATPVNIALDGDGTRYVADTGRGQVVIFGADDSYRGAIGERSARTAKAHGKSPADRTEAKRVDGTATAMKPTDVLVAGERLYVADMSGHCIRVYDKAKREQLFTIPRDPTNTDVNAMLVAPSNLAIGSNGCLYASDTWGFRVQQYDPDGRYVRTFGRGAGDRPGEFSRPKGVAVDREGRVYVVDAATELIQIFDAEGRLLLFFGEPQDQAPGLELPAKVLIDYDHVALFERFAAPNFQIDYLVLVSNQYGSHKVTVYGFGHPK